MLSKSIIRESYGDKLFLVLVYTFLAIILITVLYPLWFVVISSFSSSDAVIQGEVWFWPVRPTLFGYEAVFKYPMIWRSYSNTIVYTASGSAISVLLSIMMAYPLSKPTFYGKKVFIWALLFALMFHGGLIPFYLTVKSLGMINTMWALILPPALNIFSVFIAKTFFQTTISKDLYESTQIDGCGDIGFIWRMVIPLSMPIIAVLFLWAAVTSWNSYFSALVFLNTKELFPLQLILREILVLNDIANGGMNLSPEEYKKFEDMRTLLKYSVIVFASFPILCLYPFLQRYFVKGVMLGSLKE
ncbi:MAG: carbohydrate ABC transporter permease [Paenibacillaceae bacterium]